MSMRKQPYRAREEAMTFQSKRGTVTVIVALLFIAGALFMGSKAIAADHSESQCYGYVQGKVKWNYDHDATWDPDSVKQLCKGTTEYKEPGECFHRVMHGGSYGNDGINWGKGTKWKWQNAVALCAGTDNAENRINCFKGRVTDDEKWDAAIAQCVRLTSAGR